jgi:CRP-like cAMP-binding protein
MPSNQPALSRFLNRLLSRSALGDEEQQAILGLTSHAVQVRPNYDIVTPGDTVDHACLVAHGLAARYDHMTDGKRQLTAFYIDGDMCDLHSVVCPTAAWGIVALTTTTVLKVPHSELRALVDSYPAIALAFWRDGTVDASILAKWIGNVGRRDARARMAHVFCELGLRMEAAGLGNRDAYWFDVSQQNLSDALGLTAVHVNRTLQILRSNGFMRTESRNIFIDDWARLCDVAEFDAAYLLLPCSGHERENTSAQQSRAGTTVR